MTTATPPALRLSDLASRIDMKSFYERFGAIVSGKPTNSKEGKEYAACCPRCGGTDRFSFWESGRFNCVRGCGWHGSSPYFFLRDEGYSHLQALEELGIDQEEIGDSFSQPEKKLPLFLTRDEPPNKKWQEAAAAFCHAAEKCLWSSKGETARAYLQSRGLTEKTIKQARLGLCPDWYKAPLESWGLDATQLEKTDDPQIKIPRGLVLPWFVDGNIHKIQIRRPEPGPDGKKYKEVTGSSDALYNIDAFADPGWDVLLVESELDALSAMQEAGDLVACLATGSTAKARTNKWIAKLKQANCVLQAFDNDEAGEAGAAEWQRALPNATRWTPWSHDVNDMLKENHDIRLWVEAGLDVALGAVKLAPAEAMAEVLFSLEDAHKPTEQGETFEIVYVDGSTETVTLPATPPALLDRNGKPIPPELAERVRAFQERPCIACGGYDWMIDPVEPDEWVPEPTRTLICPCLLEKRKQNALPRPVLVLPTPAKQSSFQGYWKQ